MISKNFLRRFTSSSPTVFFIIYLHRKHMIWCTQTEIKSDFRSRGSTLMFGLSNSFSQIYLYQEKKDFFLYSNSFFSMKELNIFKSYFLIFFWMALQFWRPISKSVGRGLLIRPKKILVKPTRYNIFSYILFNVFNVSNLTQQRKI